MNATAAKSSAATGPAPTSLRTLLAITWPQLMMMLFQMLIGFTDVFVAGRIDGGVQAALGLVTECMFVFLVLGMAVANAGVATISQSLGARLRRRAQRYVGLLFSLGLAMCLIIVIATLLWRENFLTLQREKLGASWVCAPQTGIRSCSWRRCARCLSVAWPGRCARARVFTYSKCWSAARVRCPRRC